MSRGKKADTGKSQFILHTISRNKNYRLGCTNGVPIDESERVYLVIQLNFNTPDIRECDRGIQMRGRRPIIAESPGQV